MFEITEVFLQEDDAKDIKKKAAQKTGKLAHVDPPGAGTTRAEDIQVDHRADCRGKRASVLARGLKGYFQR